MIFYQSGFIYQDFLDYSYQKQHSLLTPNCTIHKSGSNLTKHVDAKK